MCGFKIVPGHWIISLWWFYLIKHNFDVAVAFYGLSSIVAYNGYDRVKENQG